MSGQERFEENALGHAPALYRMALYLSGNREDAEDLVQEVFIKARASFHTLKNIDKCKSWLCSILYRKFVDEYRKRKNHVELFDLPAKEEEEEQWPHDITAGQLKTALDRLDPKYRLPVVAHFLSGQSYQEIAAQLDLPIGTVMSRIHRAKKALRKDLTSNKHKKLKMIIGGKSEQGYGM